MGNIANFVIPMILFHLQLLQKGKNLTLIRWLIKKIFRNSFDNRGNNEHFYNGSHNNFERPPRFDQSKLVQYKSYQTGHQVLKTKNYSNGVQEMEKKGCQLGNYICITIIKFLELYNNASTGFTLSSGHFNIQRTRSGSLNEKNTLTINYVMF